jgi:putative phosphoesterase
LLLVALFSDIHANLPALEAAVKDAKHRGADRILCAGDITGYGPFPDETCTFMQSNSIQSIAGNYDTTVLTVIREGPQAADGLQKKKQKIVLWTSEHISRDSRKYLAGLPEHLAINLPNNLKLTIVHGTPLDTADDIYPSLTAHALKNKIGDISTDILVCGHTHIPFVKKVGSMLVINCGSVGQPVDGDWHPAYALLSIDANGRAQARIIRFNYDIERTLAAMQDSSLPKGLRKDLKLGTKRIFML